MAVITISREFGSGGRTIAEQLAHKLGYQLVDKKKMSEVLIQYGFVEFQYEYDSEQGFWARFDERRSEMIGMLNRVIQALAQHGNVVIMGRGSYAVLGGFADVLNVRVQAALSARTERVMTRYNLTDIEQASRLVRKNDKIRTNFINAYYSIPWDATHAFDMVINTGKIFPDMAVDWLVEATNALQAQCTDDLSTVKSISVDGVLAKVVTEVLDGQPVY